jgi:cob(I)alamin adenosyltransferase
VSIVTRTGDSGTTGLMYNRRVPKSHARVEAYGVVDELNAAVGLARATATDPRVAENLLLIQKDLVLMMGELATLIEDLPRYQKDGYPLLNAALTAKLDQLVREIEPRLAPAKDWVMPGSSIHAAALDIARTTCRRAERRACALHETDQLRNPEIIVYLNRLSDLLWLLARKEEQQPR